MSNGNKIGISIIADRYADALIELGEKYNQLDAFDADLSKIKKTLESCRELTTFLEHPTIPVDDKKEIIDRIFKDSVAPYILNTLKLLLDRNRIFILPAIVNHYHKTLNHKRKIVIAQVITAISIDEDTINKIKTKLANMLNQNIEIETQIDSEIIAGMVVKIGDKIIDGSIKTRLENMKKQLI